MPLMATRPFAAAENSCSPAPEAGERGIGGMPWPAICAVLLSLVGVCSIWSTVLFLEDLWRTDPLKSIGACVPWVSALLILRAWRALGWELDGSWWGMAILLPTVALVHWRDQAVLELVLAPCWTIFFPPHSLVAFAYVSGVVLLFGGARLYRAALFPIALMFLVNPLPHFFNHFVDLPMQHLSAVTARRFAQALGQRLTPSELSLMFTPSFGMFIAPGCNGIRGSVTMGVIALVAGYLYRFRLAVWTTAVAGAVLLGYGFNLLRLCALVVYYIVALRIPWLQSRAEMGDYVIGASLFFLAAVLLFEVIRHFSPTRDLRPPPLCFRWLETRSGEGLHRVETPGGKVFLAHGVAFAILVAAGSVSYARRWREPRLSTVDEVRFPAQLGRYRLQRMWKEQLSGGTTIFDWAGYAVPEGRSAIEVGVSPVLGAHDTLLCHTARGEAWLWHGDVTLPTVTGPVSFSTSLYEEGATGYLEASTVCSGQHCGQWSPAAGRQFGFVYSRTDAASLLRPERPIPVLLKVKGTEGGGDPVHARAMLQAQLADFLQGTSMVGLTAPYRVR